MWRTLTIVFAMTFGLALIVPNLPSAAGPASDAAATDKQAPLVASAVAPSSSPAPVGSGMSAELTRGPDMHFRADALVNGQRVQMLVDSGASLVALPEPLARQMGIAPPPTAFTGHARTAGGDVAYAPIHLASIRIGDVERVDVPAAVMQGDALDTPLLGQSFLSMLSEVTISGNSMRLR